ncbi:hypothetical protein V7112_09815 [Bacillus sp. JJ1566]|uniref:hypothetical protein n=1 Tax=Bacillus sp. JJ1566 TaxID=3122961 RepID=UPI002FFE6625
MDKRAEKESDRVQKRVSFGQRDDESVEMSQNAGIIWTREQKKRVIESKSEGHGQREGEDVEWSPNQVVIRTWKARNRV